MPKLAEKYLCTGCSACSNACSVNCITMAPNDEGFLYPIIDRGKCIECRHCENVCPVLNRQCVHSEAVAFAGRNKNESIVKISSSGGMFSAIAAWILGQDGAVFGAAFNENFEVVHTKAENVKELAALYTSKYVQSRIGYSLREIKNLLDSNRYVLFAGTPCQIAGLKRYLGKEYGNLYCQDIVCHGVPSPLVWKEYLKIVCKGRTLKSMSFRDKVSDWSDYFYKFEFSDGTVVRQRKDASFYSIGFINNVFLRHSCHNCLFKGINNRTSDITLGDFWGVGEVLPEMDNNTGLSLVICNSEKGLDLVNQIAPVCEFKAVEAEKAVLYNQCAVQTFPPNDKRAEFFSLFLSGFPERALKKYCGISFIPAKISLAKRLIKKMIYR